jgi:sec-independent protein translocase protein TatC
MSMQPRDDSALGILMSFGDHLEELRRRVLLGIIVPVPAAILLFAFAGHIRSFLCIPLVGALLDNGLPGTLQVMSPLETLTIDMKLSLIGAFIIGAPWVLWQAWLFIRPGLYQHERRFVRLLLPGSAVLAMAGAALLYWVILPAMLTILVGMSAPPATLATRDPSATGDAAALVAAIPALPTLSADPANPRAGQMWINTTAHAIHVAVPAGGASATGDATAADAGVQIMALPLTRPGEISQAFRLSEYLDFVLTMFLCVAIAFQLPVAMLLLSWTGLVRAEWLRSKRRFALLGVVLAAAVISPGDVLSLVMLAVPLYLLFELSLVLMDVATPRAVARGTVLSGTVTRMRGGRVTDAAEGDE